MTLKLFQKCMVISWCAVYAKATTTTTTTTTSALQNLNKNIVNKNSLRSYKNKECPGMLPTMEGDRLKLVNRLREITLEQ